MTPHEAHEAWQRAETAYSEESDRYVVIRDASEPLGPLSLSSTNAAAELTALRDAAQAAQDAYVQAIASQAN